MNFKVLQRILLVAVIAGVSTAIAQAQISAHVTLPRLDVHVMAARPPAPRYEVRGPRPGEGYVWVGGFWTAEGGRWEWVPGHWDQPPEQDVYWIQPRYVHSYGEYIYEPGHWSNQSLNVGEDVRGHRSWQRHERDHEREMEREHNGYYNRDRDRDRDRDRQR